MDIMLRQMRSGIGGFRLDGGLVALSAATPDPLRLEAIDIMLELTGGKPLDFNARLKAPLLLQFTWGSDEAAARPFTVALLPKGQEQQAERLNDYRRARVIWLSDTGTPPDGLALPPKHFFAARMSDGTHRFYGSNEP